MVVRTMRGVEHYRDPARASHYRDKHRVSFWRRRAHRREHSLLARALAGAPQATVLDCPCGAGRMLDLATAGVDLSLAMVREARAHADCRLLVAGSADMLPFRDGAFDAVICHRLLHHLHEPAARAAILREAARVARHTVVVSYWDVRARRPKRSRRSVLTKEQLVDEAAAAGLELQPPVRYVARWFSAFAVATLRRASM